VKALAELKRMRREADAPRETATSADDHPDADAEPPRELAELRSDNGLLNRQQSQLFKAAY
jgi:hypothetical protein